MPQIIRGEIEPQFTAEDVRQHVWCPRMTYVRHVLQYKPEITLKMKKGHEKHEKQKKKLLLSREEVQRGGRLIRGGSKGVAATEYHNIYLKSEELGLRGIIDRLVILSDDEVIPINIKTGGYAEKSILPNNYKAQLVTEALLIEATTHYRVPQAAIQPEEGPLRNVEITPEDKLWILKMIRQMRAIVQTEIIPAPTPHSAKCVDCEMFPACKRS